MKNKKAMSPYAIIIIGVIALLIIFGNADTGTIFGPGNPPHYIYSTADSSCSCVSTSRFFGEVGSGYQSKTNVAWANTYDDEKAIENDDRFIWDIGLRCSRESQGFINKDGSIPAQKKCDGTLDCNFGYTNEEWVLREDKCYLKPEPIMVYRLENNNCKSKSILETEKISVDYDTIEECISNIQKPGENPIDTPGSNPQKLNFIDRIIQWFKNIFA